MDKEKKWRALGTIVFTPSIRQESFPPPNRNGEIARSLRHCALSEVILYYVEEMQKSGVDGGETLDSDRERGVG